MATPVILPRQGQSVESCIITQWNKKPGDAVQVGDILFTYETDKSTFEEEAKVAGTFLGSFFDEGDDVPCLLNVCVIGDPGEEFASFDPNQTKQVDKPVASVAVETVAAQTTTSAPTASKSATFNEKTFVSPRARNTAFRMNVSANLAQPTGPNGRIIERDILTLTQSDSATIPDAIVEKALASISSTTSYEDAQLSGIRKAIAKNMMGSLQNSAQLTHQFSFDATDIMALRKKLKANAEKLNLPNITLNDIVLFAVARTLKAHRDLNAHYLEKEGIIRYFSSVNLGIAVDTPRGLLVPTLFKADELSLSEIAVQSKELAKAAQDGSLSPSLMKDATFTISNLGSFGVEMFTPVINPPQTGILGVCNITQRPRSVNGSIEFYPAMGLSVTYDHRALDGAPASRFGQDLVHNLENFTLLLSR